ncbi:hypothetical protein IW261DRAFT_1414023 [Armillaria novae-zelandiae]|uniref:Uncharacterized protein n=1 Tax=Armillaria novae-zelandiae TaxID=153914 RepID=A0AA39TH46_9AGAR|nr:hypothetical protein IW261DRAFT_1414023 [Armillaria novae-zelandiae]
MSLKSACLDGTRGSGSTVFMIDAEVNKAIELGLLHGPPPPIFYIETGIAAAVNCRRILCHNPLTAGKFGKFSVLEVLIGALSLVENVCFFVVYLSCILATTLRCTILVILRIVTRYTGPE